MESYAEKNVELLLVGNKCDLKDQKSVSQDAVQVKKNIFFCFEWKIKLGLCYKKKHVILWS